MSVDDPQDFAGQLTDERARLTDSDAVHETDRTAIDSWLKQASGTVKTSTLATYVRRLRRLSEVADEPLTELDADGFHSLRFRLQTEFDYADSTVSNFEAALFRFLNDTRVANWTDDIDRTDPGETKLDPDDILLPKDIAALTDTARHQRDVALIEFLADTGARLSLTLSLRVGDVTLSDAPTYTPNANASGLKGAPITEYPLIDSGAPIRSYLRTSHPRPDDPGVALFHKVKPSSRNGDSRWGDDGAVDPNAIRQQLGRIADRAGVDKPVNPHAFRHAAITRMVREGYSRSQIEHRVHWTLDSDMWEVYEHITDQQHTEDIFREAGVIEDEDGPDRVRKQCGNCNELLAPRHEFCPNCGQPATADAESEVESAKSRTLEEIVQAQNPATRRELRTLLDRINERPDVGD